MQTPDEKISNPCGVGGYKCRCCGPCRSERKPWRRLIRRRLSVITRRAVRDHEKEKGAEE
jgi:hypothetical protein